MNSPRVILAGGTGFLGRSLAKALVTRGYEVVILTRSPHSESGPAMEVAWDGRTLGPWADSLDGAAAVVNLAGKNVNCRYTPANLREINESRTDSVKVIGEAIRRCATKPKVWVQTASLAIYGDAGDRPCDESAPPGDGVPVQTCLLWEGAFAATPTPGVRRVGLRIGFVLGRGEGALGMLARLTRWGLGGRVGSGRQFISWVHVRDMDRVFVRAIEDEAMEGVYNVCAPAPVTNAAFMRELRHALHRPWSPPAPAWAVTVGSFFLRTEPVLALTGRRGVPKRLAGAGFHFEFTDLRGALHDLLRTP